MAKIVIDGKSYEVNPDNNLLQECLSHGLDLPYFCWHPSMGSVGACRQCAVKQYRNEDDKVGTLVMACMTPANDGSIISVQDSQAREFRANVIESLMISHPHDCPVCEEGGECHLQDMTLMSGHNYRRYKGKKVTHHNQYLGPFIGHEMNRCITCYRCVRYYDDYAGGTDLAAQASHHHTYFGRQSDGCLESEFSGNLVEVCPTGVFTDATFSAHYARKWDLQSAPSICVGCAVGCNTTPGERYGTLRRIVNRYNGQINGYFLCDRGRFGYGFVNAQERLGYSFSNSSGVQQRLTMAEAGQRIASLAIEPDGKSIGIGSPRASNEANFALKKLVGGGNFYGGCSDTEFELLQAIVSINRDPRFRCPTIRQIEQADAILIIGEDVTNVAPRVALALRQSVRNRADELATSARIPLWQDAAVRELAQGELSPLTILSGYASRLDDIASSQVIDSIEELTLVATAIANVLLDSSDPDSTTKDDVRGNLINETAAVLKAARQPLIICGSSNGSMALLEAATGVAAALAQCRGDNLPIDYLCLVPEVNSLGLALMTEGGNSLGKALERMESGDINNVIVVENDLYRRAQTTQLDSAFAAVSQKIVVDQLHTATTEKADLVLASTSFPEQESTYVNYEGRAQLSMQVYMSEAECQPAWNWLLSGEKQSSVEFDALVRECDSTQTNFACLSEVLPDRGSYIGGMKVPRQSHRYSGRTAMNAGMRVHEGKQPEDTQSVMAFSMEGISPQKDASIIASTWAPQWNSNQSISKFQDEIDGELKQASPGRMLIARNKSKVKFGKLKAIKFKPAKGSFAVIPAFQIFGSDELSNHAPAIAERLTGSYVAISQEDAASLKVHQGAGIELTVNGETREFPVCIRSRIKQGTLALFNGSDRFLPLSPGCRAQLVVATAASPLNISNLLVSDLYEEDS